MHKLIIITALLTACQPPKPIYYSQGEKGAISTTFTPGKDDLQTFSSLQQKASDLCRAQGYKKMKVERAIPQTIFNPPLYTLVFSCQ